MRNELHRSENMPLSTYRDNMAQLYSARVAHASSEPIHLLFCQGLKFLMEYSADFDRCVPEENPFYQEFIKLLETGIVSDEDCFSLFECLAIFFRLRQQKSPERAPSDIERQILRHFEHCGEWQPQDNTLVSLWYWWRIPSLAGH